MEFYRSRWKWPVLELLTIYGGWEPTINSVTVPARQATQAGRIDTLESIPGLLKSWKIRALKEVQYSIGA